MSKKNLVCLGLFLMATVAMPLMYGMDGMDDGGDGEPGSEVTPYLSLVYQGQLHYLADEFVSLCDSAYSQGVATPQLSELFEQLLTSVENVFYSAPYVPGAVVSQRVVLFQLLLLHAAIMGFWTAFNV